MPLQSVRPDISGRTVDVASTAIAWRKHGLMKGTAVVEGEQPRLRRITVLPNKVRKPILPDWAISRAHVATKLESALDRQITTVVSPAGFGKTTAVAMWASALEKTPVAWLRLDKEDADAERFWPYLLDSLEKADKRISSGLEAMLTHQGPTLLFLDELIMHLQTFAKPFVLVIEDYYQIQKAEAIHDALRYIVRNMPDNVHLVVTSRATIPLPLARLRAAGKLLEIGESDLVFTAAETKQALEIRGVHLCEEDAANVHEISRGWPTGVTLIGMLCGSGSKGEVAQALSRATFNIQDYLLEEVFNGLPATLQDFLVCTATVDAYNLDLACVLSGLNHQEAASAVQFLLDNGLFVIRTANPEANGEAWYQYHLLFEDLLHERGCHFDRQKTQTLAIAARDWFDEHGFIDEAVHQAIIIHDHDYVLNTIIRHWKSFYDTDSHRALLRWADMLPEKTVLNNPFACVVLALPAMIASDYKRAETYISVARKAAQPNTHGREASDRKDSYVDNEPKTPDLLYGMCMVQESFLATYQRRRNDSDRFAAQALRYLPEDETYMRCTMLQVRASHFCYSDPRSSKTELEAALKIQKHFGISSLLVSLYCNLAVIDAQLGLDEESLVMCEHAYNLTPDKQRSHLSMFAFAHFAEMTVAYGRGELEKALAFYNLFESTVRGSIATHYDGETRCLRAKILYRLGDPSGKQAFFDAWALSENAVYMTIPSFRMMRDWCAAFGKGSSGYDRSRIERAEAKDNARVFAAMVDFVMRNDEAYADVCSLAHNLPERNRAAKIAGNVVASAFSSTLGHHQKAIGFARTAAAVAAGSGLTQLLLENAEELLPVAQMALNDHSRDAAESPDSPTNNATEIFATIVEEANATMNHATYHEATARLTARELDVLREIAKGNTVTQAAAALFISKDTAKKHLQNAYGKLGAHSKMQALEKLRTLTIIC